MNNTPTPKVATRKPRQNKSQPVKGSSSSQPPKSAGKIAPEKEKMLASCSTSGQPAPSIPQSRQKTLAKKTSDLRSPVLKLPVGKAVQQSSLEQKPNARAPTTRVSSVVKEEKKVDLEIYKL